MDIVSFEDRSHKKVGIKLFTVNKIMFVRETTRKPGKKRAVVFACCGVNVL